MTPLLSDGNSLEFHLGEEKDNLSLALHPDNPLSMFITKKVLCFITGLKGLHKLLKSENKRRGQIERVIWSEERAMWKSNCFVL